MSRVITFSTKFPAHHPRNGESTGFVEKLIKSAGIKQVSDELMPYFNPIVYAGCDPKGHTIRMGNRWKVGDRFSPRIWSGKPYASKQIIIGPDIEIKKIWDIKICHHQWRGYGAKDQVFSLYINGEHRHSSVWCYPDTHYYGIVGRLAKNDGLSVTDLGDWFNLTKKKREMVGQILCWDETIEY